MDDRQDNQSHFIHVFSTPLTSMSGAIDLLRNPKRAADPVTRDLLETLARSCARLNQNIDTLLAHSQVRGDIVEIVVPLYMLLGAPEPPKHCSPPAASLVEPSTDIWQRPHLARRSQLYTGRLACCAIHTVLRMTR